jgi:ABC-type branched-subunit amino acid transport system substrate-binding protein
VISKKWCAVLAAAALGVSAAGCGSSSSGTKTGNGGSGSSKEPLKIALVIPVTGSGAIPRIYEDPVKLAVNDLKASGVNVSYEIYDAGLTPQQAITATQRALQTKPSVIIGLPVIPQILAVGKMLDNAKVPLLQLSAGDESNYLGPGKSGGASEWSFRAGIANSVEATGGAKYMVDKLNLKKLGLMYETADPPDALIKSISTVVDAGGATLVAKRGFNYAATDLTEQVLAMKSADGIFNWGYPNTVALGLKQQFQNGINVPTMTSQSGVTGFLDGLLKDPSQLKKFYSAASCNPQDPSNSALYAWGQKFKKQFGFDPDMNSAETYDAVNIAKQAFAPGGSPDDVLKRLETQSFSGLCQTTYKADAQHNMGHSTTVIGFATGKPTTVFTYAPKQ